MSQLLAYFGGSFDPIHLGHLRTAQELIQQLHLHQLTLLPAARSPLKEQGNANAQQRLRMIELALADDSQLHVDARELLRPPPSYTIDTLKALRIEHGPQQPLAFIMGMDSFLSLPQWKDWQQLTDYAHLIVVTRPHYDAILSPELASWYQLHRCNEQHLLEYAPHGQVLLLRTTPYAISSTLLRSALARGEMPPELPNAVLTYIQQQSLYRASPTNES